MCGITGIVYNNALKDYTDVKKMNDAIKHRGPDGEGFIAVNTFSGSVTPLAGERTPITCQPINSFAEKCNLYLAHRRLSILDLSKAGHQPMSNADGSLWITFNGEIYNYKTLRNELKNCGFEFKSECDTEVLLYAYQKWGINCLQKLNGMWAFVIYDKKKNILFGARDRFGVKPLYYAKNKEFFAFNSEIKGLLQLDQINRKVNKRASVAYLTCGLQLFGKETFFESVNELEPATMFIFDLNTKELALKKYFELNFVDKYVCFEEKDAIDYIENVKRLVLNAIDLRLNADVKVGSCLSGGIDSSSIVCGINNLLKNHSISSLGTNQVVVTACYENSKIDESHFAKMVVDKTNAQWLQVFPTKNELLDDLDDLVYSQDVPFGSTSIYAQYRVMKAAKNAGLTVMLDGQGGDELFTGYVPYYNRYYTDIFLHGNFTLLKDEKKHLGNTPFSENYNIMKSVSKQFAMDCIVKFCPTLVKNRLRYIISTKGEGAYFRHKTNDYKYKSSYNINKMLYTAMAYNSLPDLLKYEDRNSMRFSIESRTPFADDIELINYVFSIPGIYKIHNGWSKYLLRQSMKDFLPEKILKRTDKIGFATPEYEWLKEIKPLVFANRNSDLNEFLKMDKLEKYWDSLLLKQKRSGVTSIWRLINFILWFNKFDVSL